MSLAIVAARAALLRKQASVGRLALAAGALGGAGLAGAGVYNAATAPAPPEKPYVNPMMKPPVDPTEPDLETYAGRKRAGKMNLRDEIRDRTTSAVASGAGNFLGNWYGAYTGKGQPK